MIKKVFSITAIVLSVSATAQNKTYKGGELYSSASVTYGKFEMCMRASKAEGVLSTFFLYKNGSEIQGAGWEEVDIEIFGKSNAMSFQSNIITGTAGAQIMSAEVYNQNSSLADAFHVYALEWTPDYIAWYLDGALMRKTVGGQVANCTNPMSLHFNTWISDAGGWAGAFTDSTSLPANQFVDFISYSSYTKGTGDNGTDFTFSWKDDFSTYNSSRWLKANWTFGGNLVDFIPGNVNTNNEMLVLSCTTKSKTGFTGTAPASACTNVGVESNESTAFNVYVADQTLFINNGNNANQISVVDVSGKKVFSGMVNNAVFIGSLPAGVYIVNIQTSNGIFNKNIVLE